MYVRLLALSELAKGTPPAFERAFFSTGSRPCSAESRFLPICGFSAAAFVATALRRPLFLCIGGPLMSPFAFWRDSFCPPTVRPRRGRVHPARRGPWRPVGFTRGAQRR